LEVVDGLLLGSIVAEFHEGETALTAGLTVERQAALADFAVLAEQIKQVLALSLEREVADVNGHSLMRNLKTDPWVLRGSGWSQ
jgi:hypothetical protein